MRIFRLLKIASVASRYGLDELVLEHEPSGRLVRFANAVQFWRDLSAPRAVRLRLALEALGPIFVKFGQVLSTRRDLMPADIADELAKLQDRVPPFDSQLALAEIEKAYGRPASEVFAEFDPVPVASASIAQVHFARLKDEDGSHEVAVKILRPNMLSVIDHDLALMDTLAMLLEKLWSDGKRLKPREVVAEFAKYLRDELDLMREAANASQLRRNFANSQLLIVPEMHWDWCTSTVMVMERMQGTPISQIDRLRADGINLSRLSAAGVEIFFTQVFRDGFFHADMHPGNIFVAPDGRYIALDFGIVGTLTDSDKNYLAQNFLAFFRRDYKRVAEAHIESGWAPKDTRVDEFEAVDPLGLRADIRPPAEGHFLRQGAAAPVPDLAPLQCRDPAAAGHAAEDPAQHRRPRPPARSRTRPVENRQALPRTLDERTGRLARTGAHLQAGSPLPGAHAAAAAAPRASGAGPAAGARPAAADRSPDRGPTATEFLAGDHSLAAGHGDRPSCLLIP